METVAGYVTEVKRLAQDEASGISHFAYNCGSSWRLHLASKYNEKDRCPCWTDTDISLSELRILSAGHTSECEYCERCGLTWNPKTQPHAIHSHDGDYELYRAPYLAEAIHLPWTKTKNRYDNDPKEMISNMICSEEIALQGLAELLIEEPHIAAWITLRSLKWAIMLHWKRMIRQLTWLLEHRQQWFTEAGECFKWSEEYNELPSHMNERSRRFPYEACLGKYNLPLCLTGEDSSASTMNIDHAIEKWLDDSPESEHVELCARAIASSTAQWLVESTEAFYRDEQRKIIAVISHPGGIWHTAFCVGSCTQCAKNGAKKKEKPEPKNVYEGVLARARDIRTYRLWGTLRCFVRWHAQLTRLRWLRPGGKYYLEAAERWAIATQIE